MEHFFYPSEQMRQAPRRPPKQNYSRNGSASKSLEPLRLALVELKEHGGFNSQCRIVIDIFLQILDRDTASTAEGRISVVENLKHVWMMIKKPPRMVNTGVSDQNTEEYSS